MKAELHGLAQLERELDKRLGNRAMQRVSDDALKQGAKMYKSAINNQISRRPDKGYAQGYTIKDTDISEPMTLNGVRTIRIHWNSSHGRYRIIHLNEFGTVKNPNPPRKGAIAVALQKGETAYKEVIKDVLRRSL